MDITAKKRISKARSELILDHPFFGCLALKLTMEENSKFPTLMTDGKALYYNPDFINSLDRRELVGVLAHEISHICLGHCWRRDDRNKATWNIAGDYATNTVLIHSGFKLPEGALIDETGEYDKLSAEEIYKLLPEQEEKQKQSSSGQGEHNEDDEDNDSGQGEGESDENDNQDPGNCGGVMDAQSKQEAKENEQEWKAAMSQAMQIAKGEMPANLKRQIEDILNPELPWQSLLRDFVEYSARNDYNWNRPSRRYFGNNIVLPSLISEELPEVVVAIDTSGSISQKELSEFGKEVSSILEAYETNARVVYCDAKVQNEEVFARADMPLKLNAMGGGGTSFVPVFKHVYKNGLTPSCLIYFTDLYGDFPSKAPDYPVMWVTKSKREKAPFGVVIRYK